MEATQTIKGAPIWKRFVGHLIDFLIILIIFSLISGYTSAHGIGEISGYLSASIAVGGIVAIIKSLLLIYISVLPYQVGQETIYLIGLIIYYGYFLFFELTIGTTIGKLVLNMKLVSTKSELRPSDYQILIRSLCRLIPFDPFSYISKHPNGWHDSIPKVTVINKKNISKERETVLMNTEEPIDDFTSHQKK